MQPFPQGQYLLPWSCSGTSLQRHFVLLSLPAGTGTTPSGNGTEEEPARTEVPPPHENITGISPLTLGMSPSTSSQTCHELLVLPEQKSPSNLAG